MFGSGTQENSQNLLERDKVPRGKIPLTTGVDIH